MFQGMRYVYEVYKEMSFSRAAKNLYISQPSLSTAVKKGGSISGPPKPCWMWKTAFAAMWTT